MLYWEQVWLILSLIVYHHVWPSKSGLMVINTAERLKGWCSPFSSTLRHSGRDRMDYCYLAEQSEFLWRQSGWYNANHRRECWEKEVTCEDSANSVSGMLMLWIQMIYLHLNGLIWYLYWRSWASRIFCCLTSQNFFYWGSRWRMDWKSELDGRSKSPYSERCFFRS